MKNKINRVPPFIGNKNNTLPEENIIVAELATTNKEEYEIGDIFEEVLGTGLVIKKQIRIQSPTISDDSYNPNPSLLLKLEELLSLEQQEQQQQEKNIKLNYIYTIRWITSSAMIKTTKSLLLHHTCRETCSMVYLKIKNIPTITKTKQIQIPQQQEYYYWFSYTSSAQHEDRIKNIILKDISS
jgi:hypothetical protein